MPATWEVGAGSQRSRSK